MFSIKPTAVNLGRQCGAGLLEVLIAVMILSVGLLGLAGLQATGLKVNASSLMRSEAVMMSYGMLDAIRANPTGTYTRAFGAGPPSADNCQGSGADCDVAELAKYDLAFWKCGLGNFNSDTMCDTTLSVAGNLPSGDGAITKAGDVYTISVRWVDDNDGATVKTFQVSASI